MRQWIALVEGWHSTAVTEDGTVDIFKNPTAAELKKLFATVAREHRLDGRSFPLRASVTKTDLYVWDAYKATHQDIIYGHGIPTVGGYLYLTQNEIIFNDLNWDYNEDDDEAWKKGRIYGPVVRLYYEATRNNASLRAFYGNDPKIVGIDDEDRGELAMGSRFLITDEFMTNHVM